MKFGKNGDDPTSRRRQDPDAAKRLAREIIRRHLLGQSVREISRAVDLPRTSVHRIIQDYEAQQRQQQLGLDRELDAALAQYQDSELLAEDVTTVEQIAELNDCEYHRLRYLPLTHPVREMWRQAVDAGYR